MPGYLQGILLPSNSNVQTRLGKKTMTFFLSAEMPPAISLVKLIVENLFKTGSFIHLLRFFFQSNNIWKTPKRSGSEGLPLPVSNKVQCISPERRELSKACKGSLNPAQNYGKRKVYLNQRHWWKHMASEIYVLKARLNAWGLGDEGKGKTAVRAKWLATSFSSHANNCSM